MKNLLKFILLILAALLAGGVIGWVGGLIGYTTPTIVAIVIAIGAILPYRNRTRKREQVA